MGNLESGIQVPEFLTHKLAVKPEIPIAKLWREDISPFVFRLISFLKVVKYNHKQSNDIDDEEYFYYSDPQSQKLDIAELEKLSQYYQNFDQNPQYENLCNTLTNIRSELCANRKWYKGIDRWERDINDQIGNLTGEIYYFFSDQSRNLYGGFGFLEYNFCRVQYLEKFLDKLKPLTERREILTSILDSFDWNPTLKKSHVFLEEETYSDLEIIKAIDFDDITLSEMRDAYVYHEEDGELCTGDTSGYDLNGCMDFLMDMNVHRFLIDRHLSLTEFMLKWSGYPTLESMAGTYSEYGFHYFLDRFSPNYWPHKPHFFNWLKSSPFRYPGRVNDNDIPK